MKTFLVHVIIVQSQAKKFSLQVNQGMPVHTLKATIQEHTSILSDNQRLIYAGKEMKDSKILRDYGVAVGMTVHCAQRGKPVSLPVIENSLHEMQITLENVRKQKEKEKADKLQMVASGSKIGGEKDEVIDLEMKGDGLKSMQEQTGKNIVYATSLHDSIIEDGRGSPNENVNNNRTQVERSNKRKRDTLSSSDQSACSGGNDPNTKKNVEIIIDEEYDNIQGSNVIYGNMNRKANTKPIDRRSGSTSSSATLMPIYSNTTTPQVVAVNPTIILDSDDEMSEIDLKGKEKDGLKDRNAEYDDNQHKNKKRKKMQQPEDEARREDDDDDVILVL